MFFSNVAPFERKINRLSNRKRVIAKKHCYIKEIVLSLYMQAYEWHTAEKSCVVGNLLIPPQIACISILYIASHALTLFMLYSTNDRGRAFIIRDFFSFHLFLYPLDFFFFYFGCRNNICINGICPIHKHSI